MNRRHALSHARPVTRRFGAALVVALVAAHGARAAAGQSLQAACADCHAPQAAEFAASVHHAAVRCQDCHGGEVSYWLDFEQRRAYAEPRAPGAASRPAFDHGASFRGKAKRSEVPERCGTCHADVERMNPFGLRTDQLAAYWVSGHGKRLKREGDEKVAVCIDCHGTHDVLRHDDPRSRTHVRNIPDTCARCHADAALMAPYNLSTTVVAEYRASVHGRNLLERGDAGSPNCATCHGSHAAAPPGYLEVGHVCGKCHQQIEEYFLQSVHGRVPVMARCVGCHGKGGDRRNHEIGEASPAPEVLLALYAELRAADPRDPEALASRFHERVDGLGGALSFREVCLNCHGEKVRRSHGEFFQSTDRTALEKGSELSAALRKAQFEYVRIAERVARAGRGVLLVQDEAVRVEDVKTELMALYAFLHTLNTVEAAQRAAKLHDIVAEIDGALDSKEAGLTWRYRALMPIWAFILVFAFLMYRKFLALKHQYVRTTGPVGAPQPVAPARGPITRRRVLDAILSGMGATIVVGLLWPAIAYVLPARKRGGGAERVSAGKADGWAEWEVRKVSVQGKPVAVLRTDKEFRAFSAVCTHLGCIVHWETGSRHFACPCHAATFDAAGQVVSGPPPRGLPVYGVAVVQGEVIVKGAGEG